MRLVIVSNRLPFTVQADQGTITMKPSAGGLASGLSTYLEALGTSPSEITEYVWIGWPGSAVDESQKEQLTKVARDEYHAAPVYLSEERIHSFYYGFCNSTVWPLFHYFVSQAKFDDEQWEEYVSINQIFLNSVLEVVRPNDIVWIHDYHLMLLPQLLRERHPNLPIGFFLHIPFPSVEVFRLFPTSWRKAILEGLLGADLIGFHTEAYAKHFEETVQQVLGVSSQQGQIRYRGRAAQVEAFQMGIDYRKFADATRDSPEVQTERNELLRSLAGLKVILSLDRLDYTKGILHRLYAYRTFLQDNPEWHGKLVLVLVVVPSRDEVSNYAQLKLQIEQVVGKINGEFGHISWVPILYQYRSVPFEALIALYSVADIAMITPLRDGMNLVSKEYIASRRDNSGVLILSEMAGSAQEMTGAIIVNPNDEQELSGAILRALEMPVDEQTLRNAVMRRHLQENDVVRWGAKFVRRLMESHEASLSQPHEQTPDNIIAKIADAYRQSQRRLLFLDYDGTLVPFADTPGRAWPDGDLLVLLDRLSKDPKNELVLASGRSRHDLEYWFGDLDIALAAEHGLWIRERGRDWQMTVTVNNEWRVVVRQAMERHVRQLPGSFIEEKDASLVWHYRLADQEAARSAVVDLSDELLRLTQDLPFQVVLGNMVVETSSVGIHKGTTGEHWLNMKDWDFILAMGDDRPDERLFGVMPPTAFTVSVGKGLEGEVFRLRDHQESRALLKALADITPGEGEDGTAAKATRTATARLLVVDDDPAVLSGLRRGLMLEGYDVRVAPDGETALKIAAEVSPDLVIMDVAMPGMDGLTATQRLRETSSTPILILSAKDTLPDRVAGLDKGADDYLVKPFALDELLARVRALLRRSQQPQDSMLEYGYLRLDTRTHEAFRAGVPVKLTAREYELLRLFLRNPRQVLTREQICQQVWGYEFDNESNFIDAIVKDLRKKLETADRPRLIQTVRGYGYALREE